MQNCMIHLNNILKRQNGTIASKDAYLGKRMMVAFWERKELVISRIMKEASRFWQVLFLDARNGYMFFRCDKSLNCTSCFVHVSMNIS